MADPVQQEHRDKLNLLAKALDGLLNGDRSEDQPKLIFALLVAESGNHENGRVNYISNGDRTEMLTLLREFLARAQGDTGQGSSTVQ